MEGGEGVLQQRLECSEKPIMNEFSSNSRAESAAKSTKSKNVLAPFVVFIQI